MSCHSSIEQPPSPDCSLLDELDWLVDTLQAPDLSELQKFADSLSEASLHLQDEQPCPPEVSAVVGPKAEVMEPDAYSSPDNVIEEDAIIVTVPADDVLIEDAVEEVVTIDTDVQSPGSYSSSDSHSDLGYESLDSPDSGLHALFPELL